MRGAEGVAPAAVEGGPAHGMVTPVVGGGGRPPRAGNWKSLLESPVEAAGDRGGSPPVSLLWRWWWWRLWWWCRWEGEAGGALRLLPGSAMANADDDDEERDDTTVTEDVLQLVTGTRLRCTSPPLPLPPPRTGDEGDSPGGVPASAAGAAGTEAA